MVSFVYFFLCAISILAKSWTIYIGTFVVFKYKGVVILRQNSIDSIMVIWNNCEFHWQKERLWSKELDTIWSEKCKDNWKGVFGGRDLTLASRKWTAEESSVWAILCYFHLLLQSLNLDKVLLVKHYTLTTRGNKDAYQPVWSWFSGCQ